MCRHGENIYLRKDGRYEGRYIIGRQPNGKTKYGYVYGRKYHEVRCRLFQKKAEQPFYTPAQKSLRFGVWVEQWYLESEKKMLSLLPISRTEGSSIAICCPTGKSFRWI